MRRVADEGDHTGGQSLHVIRHVAAFKGRPVDAAHGVGDEADDRNDCQQQRYGGIERQNGQTRERAGAAAA